MTPLVASHTAVAVPEPGPDPRLLGAAALVLAAVVGAALALLGPRPVLLAGVALAPLPFILRDFRLGVVLLTLALPLAPMLPSVRGLNLLNVLTLATLTAFTLRAAFSRVPVVGLPAPLWWGLVLPVTVGLAVAWPHIPEGVRNYPTLAAATAIYDPPAYAMARWAKPLFHHLAYAFLLANAVRASAQPQRFVWLLAAAAVLPSLAVLYTVARYPGPLGELIGDREFMAPRGMHANEFGLLLALACGPLLFVATATTRRVWRWGLAGVLALVFGALVLTFSRGALLACLVMLAGFLWHHRRLKTMLATAALALVALVAAPDALQERFGAGLRAGALSDTSRAEHDELTAGRVHGWTLLAPEVLESPWIGRGLGSTQWSAAVAAGLYRANHPHNIYLEVLMDLGLLGLAAMAWAWWHFLRRLRQLAAEPAFTPELRAFFLGARWAAWGALAMAATTAYYMPNAAQTFLWMGLGMAFAYWKGVPSGTSAAARGVSP
jgi:O-antigen ligase